MKQTRRDLLRAGSALTAAAIGASTVATAQRTGGDGGAYAQSVTNAEIRTTNRDCDTRTVTLDEGDVDAQTQSSGDVDGDAGGSTSTSATGTVELSGQLSVPHPCHDAVFTEISRDDGTLYVTIGADAHDGFCMMCLGIIEYEATIELSEPVDDVVVRHE